MEWKEEYILVFGAGVSGIAAASLLSSCTKEIILYDTNEKLKPEEICVNLPENFSGEIVLGELTKEQKEKITRVILSPGVPTDCEEIKEFQNRNVPIWGEIELAYQFAHGKLAAITGTNGKTTTTTLAGEILKTFFKEVFVVGNIGLPYTKVVKQTTENSVTVAEMSSFQLETIESFRPDVSIILNITPDHLNRHHTMENYILAKANIMKNQTSSDLCVLNYEDEVLRKLGEKSLGRVLWFSSARKLEKGFYLDSDLIIYNDGKKETVLCNIHELNILGKHNYENVMAACAVGLAFGIPVELIHHALVSFVAVEHRIEYVATIDGVKYYNDSKGTNPDASIQAVRAMQSPTLLIGGGYDKGSQYEDWIASFEGKVKYLVLMGQTKEKIAQTARSMGFEAIVFVDSMQEAVAFCADHAEAGDCVLLSPCCASWGMFKNYEERGKIFKELVHTIK